MKVDLRRGDCLELLRTLVDCSVDSCVTDPPYGLSEHSPEEVAACLAAWIAGQPYSPKGKGFMGRAWDAWVPGPEVWREVFRVLKPGGHVLAFAGTRSMDLMCMAVRLAGFELRDSIGYAHDGGGAPVMAWVYGSGFPKSRDIAKAIDKEAGAERTEVVGRYQPPNGRKWNLANDTAKQNQNTYGADVPRSQRMDITAPATVDAQKWQGWGTALKPAWEPIILARKPLTKGLTVAANVLATGTGAINIDGCRIPANDPSYAENCSGDRGHAGTRDGGEATSIKAGGGTAHQAGRWPTNLIHDGSDGVVSKFPAEAGAAAPVKGTEPSDASVGRSTGARARAVGAFHADTGSAARFFYCAKASRRDRNDGLEGFEDQASRNYRTGNTHNGHGGRVPDKVAKNTHPTVKPTDLMRYLVRLVTPPGGTVLDIYMGSGSTGKGAALEGFDFIGFELDPDNEGHVEVARARINHAMACSSANAAAAPKEPKKAPPRADRDTTEPAVPARNTAAATPQMALFTA